MRGLEASRSHQQQARRNSENLMKIFRKFDLDGDGELTTKEFVCALRSHNAQLSDHAVRLAARDVDSNGDGLVDYRDFTARLAADGKQLPVFLKGKRWRDSGDIVGCSDASHAEEVRRHDKQRYLRGVLKQHEGEDGAVDAQQLAEALGKLNTHLTSDEVSALTRQACGDVATSR